MKKLLSVVMLVCLMVSVCTVSAWAAEPVQFLYTNVDGGAEYYSVDIYSGSYPSGNFSANSLEIKMFHDDILLSLTTPRIGSSTFPSYPIEKNVVTCRVIVAGNPSSSWETIWYQPISDALAPNKVIVYMNGVVHGQCGTVSSYDSCNNYDSFKSPDMPVVTMSNGIVVGYYNNLEEAVAAAPSGSNSDILIREAGNYVLPDGQGKNIVFTDTVSGVVIDMQNSNGNYGSVNFGGNITVNNRPVTVNPPAPNNPAPAAPVVENVYYIPATDDNSNMALWSILALALLSTAFVTRKRKSEN